MISLAPRSPSSGAAPDLAPPIAGQSGGGKQWTGQWLYWLSLTLVCFAFFGQVPPDVNESHYLTKAKQFWNPEWCSGDLFLESADAHWLFFASTGWLTCFLSLANYAWLGRLASWLLFSAAWLQLSRELHPRRWFSLLSLPLFLLFNLRFHLAGEWVVGGFEGKSLAYGCGIWALATWLRGQWPQTILWLGGAIGFHALAGGWLALAILLVTCSFGVQALLASIRACLRPASSLAWLPICVGVLLAATGILPGLFSQSGTSTDVLREAAAIQVTQRLSHHLWFTAFPTSRVAVFAVLSAFGLILFHRVLWSANLGRLQRLALVGLAINLAGLCLSAVVADSGLTAGGLAATGSMPSAELACSLLRFYWFRYADFAVPLAVSLSVASLLSNWSGRHNPLRLIWIGRGVLSLLLVAAFLQAWENWEPGRAGADAAALERFPDDPAKERKLAANWRKACEWVARETPPEALFITPARQQSFKWYAGRAEVVCWKDMPQDPSGIIEWSRRLERVYRPQLIYELGLLAYSDEQLRELCTEFGATYLIVPQAAYDQAENFQLFTRVYPADPSERVSFVVLKLGE